MVDILLSCTCSLFIQSSSLRQLDDCLVILYRHSLLCFSVIPSVPQFANHTPLDHRSTVRAANMQYKTLLTTALLAGPAVVAARGTLGFAVGNTTPDNKCKLPSDYKKDFDAIKAESEAKLIRTYSNTDQFGNPCDTAKNILPAAKEAGLQVLLGMW